MRIRMLKSLYQGKETEMNITPFPKKKQETRYLGTLRYVAVAGRVMDEDESREYLKKKERVEREAKDRL